MNSRFLLLLFTIIPSVAGADFVPGFNPDGTKAIPWSAQPFLNNEDHFQFVIVTDRTGGQRDGVFKEAVGKINLMRPEFVMSVGDLVEGYFDDVQQNQREWDYFDGLVDDLDMRFFYLPGNHDIWSDFSREAWDKRFGASYYHFLYKGVLFLAINSEDGQATTVGPEQTAYFLKVLEEQKEVRWTLVFTHKPMWYYEETGNRATGWQPIEDALKDRKHTVFAGHRHRYQSFARNNTRYIQLATTGGGSDLSGAVHGRFDHFVWVTMTEEGPTIANIVLDGVLDQDVRTEETGEVIDVLGQQVGVRIDPIRLGGGDRGLAYQTTLRVTNKSELPVAFEGRFAIGHGFLASSQGMMEEIPGDSEFELPVVFERGDRVEGAGDVVPFHYSFQYHPAALGPVLWERTAFAAIESVRSIPVLEGAIVVDGQAGDWDSFEQWVERPLVMSGARQSWTGPQDLSYEFALRQDDSNLYIGVQVVDDSYIDKGPVSSGAQDHFLVTLDARTRDQ